MRYLRIVILTTLALLPVISVVSQGGAVATYAWEEGDLALVYPADWDEPLPGEVEGRPVLSLAQAFVASPDLRPPGIPIITLTVIRDLPPEESFDPDLYGFLEAALREEGVIAVGPVTTTVMDIEAVMTTGTSADGLLFSTGRAVQMLDNNILLVTGRGLAEQRDSLIETFEQVVNSLVQGAGIEPELPGYGVLWHTERGPADGEDAFLEFVAMTLGPDNTLYALDFDLGVIRFDALTGAVLDMLPIDDLELPSDVAVDEAGTVFVADQSCNCVQSIAEDGGWQIVADAFGEDAPRSLAVLPDGTLYATDQDEEGGISLRVLQDGRERTITLGEDIFDQPLLTVDRAGRVLALVDDVFVYLLQGEELVPLAELDNTLSLATDFTVDASNHYVIATDDQGIAIFDTDGLQIDQVGRIVPGAPLPGELVSPDGVAVDLDGTLFWVDSDGTFGAVTAMSTRVESGRLGATHLIPFVPVQGVLNEFTERQTWTFDGVAGEQVTLIAIDADQTEVFDVALRLLTSDGEEVAFNDDHEGEVLLGRLDARIDRYTLPAEGIFIVVVERIQDGGQYILGLGVDQRFDIDATGTARLQGELLDVFPVQRWIFAGRGGQSLTITMSAESGSLDPLLRLFDPEGGLLEENDDADDPALGTNAQIVQVRLPQNGLYALETARFEGEGRYNLVIVATS